MGKNQSTSNLINVWFYAIFICCLTIYSEQGTYADGIYYPEIEMAYKVPPDMPSQRVIITYKDGVEKLIVESALEGEGKEFGWIMPVPSRPFEFEKASPGLLKTLSLTSHPIIIHNLTAQLKTVSVVATIITFGCLVVVILKAQKIISYMLLLLTILVTFFVVFVRMSSFDRISLGRGGQGLHNTALPKVKVYDLQEIGSYDLTVLEADDAEVLGKWLVSNGFISLSKIDKPIISDYIKNGWCFVAAKLHREGAGYSRPHPLSISFRSESIIYPMRLTSTVGTPVYLELFVIGNKQARSKKLTLELSDKYYFEEKTKPAVLKGKFFPGFVGKTYRQNIGHPSAQGQMWDGCVLSKLCGTLRPSEMKKDILMELRGDQPCRKAYYSHSAAKEIGFIFCLNTWWILLIVLTGIYYGRIRKKNGRKFALIRIVMPLVLFSLLLWPVTYAVLPKVETISGKNIRFRKYIAYLNNRHEVKKAIAQEYNYFKGFSINEVTQTLESYFDSQTRKNAYTGERIQHEDSPGNYTVFEDERGIVFRTYSGEGYPDDFVIPADVAD